MKFLKTKKNKAFTLAEVLIVISVIGIVAAVTLKILNENTRGKEYNAALKENIAILSSAVLRLKADNGNSLEYLIYPNNNFANTLGDKLQPYLKYVKKCSLAGNILGYCFHNITDVRYANGNTCNAGDGNCQFSSNGSAYILSNGALVDIRTLTNSCSSAYGYSSLCAIGWLDVNGFKGPNQFSKDVFQFVITKDALIPTNDAISALSQ